MAMTYVKEKRGRRLSSLLGIEPREKGDRRWAICAKAPSG
jgi:hypothetical protein